MAETQPLASVIALGDVDLAADISRSARTRLIRLRSGLDGRRGCEGSWRRASWAKRTCAMTAVRRAAGAAVS
jgi:hypothetical protein